MNALIAAALAWTCPEPPPPRESVAGKQLLLQMIGTSGSGSPGEGAVQDILGDSPSGNRLVHVWRRDVAEARRRAVDTLHADDRARLDAAVKEARAPKDAAAVQACIEARGVHAVRATFDAGDEALGRWFAAVAGREGRWLDASAWYRSVGLAWLAAPARFTAGDPNALAALDDEDAHLERADITGLTAWLASHRGHPRVPIARALLDYALAEAGRWDEVADPELAIVGLRLRAYAAGPDGGALRERLAVAAGDHAGLDVCAQLADHYEAAGLVRGRWRWAERAIGGDRPGAAAVHERAIVSEREKVRAVERFGVALRPVVRAFESGGVDAIVSGPADGVLDVASLRAELADAGPSTEARRMLLAAELARIAGSEDARGEALFRIAEALVAFEDAVYGWPPPAGLDEDRYMPTTFVLPYGPLAERILVATLARATRTFSWGPWTDRAEALLLERWPVTYGPGRREARAALHFQTVSLAGPGGW